MGPPGIEEACEEIIALRSAAVDLNTQLRFWRRCAEQALDRWNKLEDEHETLLGRVRTLLKSEPQDVDSEAWRQLEMLAAASESE